ncbi:TlpA family protein disulfide reductase [Thiohalorhabdus sp. Cl-TMA]|uniref:TlpA family protein disulfide reductase n=1 Tax=Thiohalorhabdus methylotrophus TaxID=3242694 RepID=A0ABV4TY07_9GAMM
MHTLLSRLLLLAALLSGAVTSALAADTGDRAPDFRIQGPNFHGSAMLSELRGHVVYVDFWASWCGPCRQSFPWMNELHDRYSDDGLVIAAVNLDESTADAKRFLREVPVDFPVVFNPGGDLAEKYGVSAMPSSYLVGPDGRIVHRELGFRLGERERLERMIARQVRAAQ